MSTETVPIDDVTMAHYYYPYLILFSCVFIVVQSLIWIFKKKDPMEDNKLTTPDGDLQLCIIRDFEYYEKGRRLKKIYMLGYLLSKAAMWAKAPYTFVLLHSFYNFSIGDIGVLFLIDAICSLISGPFLGVLADTFGRKKMALIYPMQTITVILLRIYGTAPLMYFVEAITGFGGGILATCFESWLNYEMTKLYGDNKAYIDLFRKDIFSSVMFYDSVLSLAATIISAIIYNNFGMINALFFACLLSAGSIFVIFYYWSENKPNEGGR